MNVGEYDIGLEVHHVLQNVFAFADAFDFDALIFKRHGHDFMDGGAFVGDQYFCFHGKNSFVWKGLGYCWSPVNALQKPAESPITHYKVYHRESSRGNAGLPVGH